MCIHTYLYAHTELFSIFINIESLRASIDITQSRSLERREAEEKTFAEEVFIYVLMFMYLSMIFYDTMCSTFTYIHL
jgi:hypothetical protein